MQQQLQSPACINEDSSCWGWSQGAGLVVTTGLAASDFEKINRPSFFSQTLDADFHQITMVLSHLVQVVFHFAKTKFDRWEPLKRLKFAHPTDHARAAAAAAARTRRWGWLRTHSALYDTTSYIKRTRSSWPQNGAIFANVWGFWIFFEIMKIKVV